MFNILKKILISENKFTETNYERWLIDFDGNMCLTVYSLIEINNIITGSNNITLRKVSLKPYGFHKTYMNKDLIEDRLYPIINQFSERKFTPVKFYSILLKEIQLFYDGNSRKCNILIANDAKTNL